MPVSCKQIGGRFRIVEAATGKIATTPNGNARDGGGHESEAACAKQRDAINAAVSEKEKE